MKFRAVLVVALFCVTAFSIYGQKFQDKPYNKWGKMDAQKLVSDSPWSKTYVSIESGAAAEAQAIAREQGQTANRGGANPGSTSRNLGNLPVVARLHSALVVRQALVRLQQFSVGYDDMNDADKAKFDAGRKGFLDCPICKNYYVVTLTKYTDASGESVSEGIFAAIKPEDIKAAGNVYLVNDKGEKRELIEFNPAKSGSDSAVFYFKRTDDSGNPLITPESKKLELVFSNDFLDETARRYKGLVPRRFEFQVSKMIVDGNVMF